MISPFNALPAPVPTYSKKGFQFWNSGNSLLDNVVFFNKNYAPPFCYRRVSSPYTMWVVELCNDRDDPLTITVPLNIASAGGYDYIVPDSAVLADPIPEGRWYMKISDGNTSFYTEWFNVSTCLGDMLLVKWSSECTTAETPHGSLVFSEQPFSYFMYLRTPVGEREINTDIEEQDNGTQVVRISTSTRYQHVINDVFAPYMLDVFNALMHYDSIDVVNYLEGEEFLNTAEFTKVSSDPTGSGLHAITALMRVHSDWRPSCCDESSTSQCLDGIEDATYAGEGEILSGITLSEGESFLVLGTPVGGYNIIRFPHPPPDNGESLPAGTIVRALEDTLGLLPVENNLFINLAAGPPGPGFWTLNSRPIVAPNGPGQVIIMIADLAPEILALGRYVEVQYSTSSSGPWTVSGQATEAELDQSGLNVELPTGGLLWFRLRYYTHNCDYGFSHYREQEVEFPYDCSARGSSVVIRFRSAASLLVDSTSIAFFTARNLNTGVEVTASVLGSPISVEADATYCVWTSDSLGNDLGNIKGLITSEVETIDLSNAGGSLSLLQLFGGFDTVDLSSLSGLKELRLQSINLVSVDASANPLLEDFDMAGSTALTSAIVHPSAVLKGVRMNGTQIPTANVDTLCNRLTTVDVAPPQYNTRFDGGPGAPTAASLAVRTTYIANGHLIQL